MYEHAVIHAPCRKATYIHLFYSILPLFGVCRLIFYMYYYSSHIDGHMELYTDGMQAVPSDMWAICLMWR